MNLKSFFPSHPGRLAKKKSGCDFCGFPSPLEHPNPSGLVDWASPRLPACLGGWVPSSGASRSPFQLSLLAGGEHREGWKSLSGMWGAEKKEGKKGGK